MRKYFPLTFKSIGFVILASLIYILCDSALDLYNNFAYDKAILKDSPYGYAPMLKDPKDYSSTKETIRSGEYVYVVDWLSAYNSRVVFAKVKSKFNEGYINKDLLVHANININPLVSSLLILIILIYSAKKVYKKYSSA